MVEIKNFESYNFSSLLTSELHIDLNQPVNVTTLNPQAPLPLSREFLTTVKNVGLWVFILVVIADGLDQWLTGTMQDILASSQGADSSIWFYGLASIVVSVVFPVIALILISTGALLLQQLNEVCIETLRTWGKALAWSFLLILPGLYKWLRYSFVPFIVLEVPQYQEGKVDALAYSHELTKGKLLQILFLLALFSGVLPLLLTNWDQYRVLWRTPLPSLALSALETLLMILFLLLLRRIFRKSYQEQQARQVLATPRGNS